MMCLSLSLQSQPGLQFGSVGQTPSLNCFLASAISFKASYSCVSAHTVVWLHSLLRSRCFFWSWKVLLISPSVQGLRRKRRVGGALTRPCSLSPGVFWSLIQTLLLQLGEEAVENALAGRIVEILSTELDLWKGRGN